MLEQKKGKGESDDKKIEEEVMHEENKTSINPENLKKNKDLISDEDSDENKEALDEVENQVAEDSENEVYKNEIPLKDYDELEIETLVTELEQLVKNYPVQQINSHVNEIKNAFNKKFGALLAEKKKAFLEEGGNSIDFQFSSPIKSNYNTLLSQFKKKRDTYYSNLEKMLNDNLTKRLQIIDDLKSLIDDGDPNTMYKNFRELQTAWRNTGSVPKTRYNDTWKTYHHHVERFYDLLHLSNDFREVDFKNNLEEKLQIIKQAEDLALVDDVNVAFKELQKLHKVWKEDIGPVSNELREEIWQKFSNATKKIHDKRHNYFRELKTQYQDVIDAKMEVIEKIKNYDYSKNNSHSDWQKSIKEIESYRNQYFEAGKLPYSKSEPIWQQFKKATKKFNQAKNVFYKNEKLEQQNNLNKKQELIKQAQSLKDSVDWENTTNELKKIQLEWKKIGHVPRKFSDQLWKEFKDACNYYFDRFHKQKSILNPDQKEVVERKSSFIEKVSNAKKPTKESLVTYLNEWAALGSLPKSAKHLETKFTKAIDVHIEKLKIDKNEIAFIKFMNVVNGYVNEKNYRRLDSEALFVRKKIDEITREIQQLENNLSFIANDSEENPMFNNVREKIEGYKNDLDLWNLKLDFMKKLEY